MKLLGGGRMSVAVAAFSLACASAVPSPLTPAQVAFLKSIRADAVAASAKAEQQLLRAFRDPFFRLGLLDDGAKQLATMAADDVLELVKDALGSLEYTSNFGVSADWEKDHPGDGGMDLDIIEHFGYIPTMWELNATHSTLVNETPANQWGILDAAETGIYRLPAFDYSHGVTVAQAKQRPSYLGANTRRVDMGIARYGAYAAIIRNDVVRQRAMVAVADTGGWENSCNASVTPIQKWFPIVGHILGRCGAMKFEGNYTPGVADNMLHTFLRNTEMFGKIGGHLSRHVYQLLTPQAQVRPLETLFYPEGALLGDLRPVDMKLVVADFASLFGTKQAERLRSFCRRHQVPLAWAIGFGLPWDKESHHRTDFLPFVDQSVMKASDRILDPMSWSMTSVQRTPDQPGAWDDLIEDVKLCRSMPSKACGTRDSWQNLFRRLASLDPIAQVQPLFGKECQSDLCFGTIHAATGVQCLCRKMFADDADHDDIMV